jgi:hypothetical protein
MLANRSSKVCRIVSVNTSVPDRNATPIVTATAVSTKRNLCAARPFSVTLSMYLPGFQSPS